jgi:hypothetical protein
VSSIRLTCLLVDVVHDTGGKDLSTPGQRRASSTRIVCELPHAPHLPPRTAGSFAAHDPSSSDYRFTMKVEVWVAGRQALCASASSSYCGAVQWRGSGRDAKVQQLSPRAIAGGDVLNVTGAIAWNSKWVLGNTLRWTVGGETCDFVSPDEAGMNPAAADAVDCKMWWLPEASALPTCSKSQHACVLASELLPGAHNMSLQLIGYGESFADARARYGDTASVYKHDARSRPFMLEVVPRVGSVSHRVGAASGGQSLELRGASLGGVAAQVTVAGAPCVLQRELCTQSRLVCTTAPAAPAVRAAGGAAAADDANRAGAFRWFRGGRGARWSKYVLLPGAPSSELDKLANALASPRFAAQPLVRAGAGAPEEASGLSMGCSSEMRDAWRHCVAGTATALVRRAAHETVHDLDALPTWDQSMDAAVHVLEAFFHPRSTGWHSFHLTAAPYEAALYIGGLGNNASGSTGAVAAQNVSLLIARDSRDNGWAGYRDWFGCKLPGGCVEHQHAPLWLERGRQYYLRASHLVSNHYGYQALAVRLPSLAAPGRGGAPVCSPAALRELQMLRIRPVVTRERQRIQLANTTTGGSFELVYEAAGNYKYWSNPPFDASYELKVSKPIPAGLSGHQNLQAFARDNAPVRVVALGGGAFEITWDFPRRATAGGERPLVVPRPSGLVCEPPPCQPPVVTRTAAASAPLGGSFRVRTSATGWAAPLSFDAPASTLQAAVSDLVQSRVSAQRESVYLNPADGIDFAVFFDGARGDEPPLELDTSGLTGGANATHGPAGTVVEVVNGSCAEDLLGPIPGGMLSTVEPAGQVHVAAHGERATCAPGACDYTADASLAPVLLSVAPHALQASDNASALAQLRLTGSGFFSAGGPVVAIGPNPCRVTAWSNTSIACELSLHHIEAGNYSAVVRVAEVGDSASQAQVSVAPMLHSFAPLRAGYGGGALVLLRGVGFGASTTVVIGGQLCVPQNCSSTRLWCEVPAVPSAPPGASSVPVVVHVAGIPHMLPQTFEYDPQLTPSLAAVTPAAVASSAITALTLSGNGFGNSAAAVRVQLGNEACHVRAVSDRSIECVVGALPLGSHSVSARIAGRGHATAAGGALAATALPQVRVVLGVGGVAPGGGSLLGGTRLAITGEGFSDNLESNVVTVGHGECAVTFANFSRIECVTPRQWTRFVSSVELGAVENATSAVHVAVRNALSTCDGNCSWRWDAALTPTVRAAQVAAGGVLRLGGSGFEPGASTVYVAPEDGRSALYSPCPKVSVRSAGYHAGNTAEFTIDGVKVPLLVSRGVTVVTLGALGRTATAVRTFDTHSHAGVRGSAGLVSFLEALPRGTAVLAAAADDASRQLTAAALQALRYIGMQGGELAYRESLAIIGYAGANETTSSSAAASGWLAHASRSASAVHLVGAVPCAALSNFKVRPPSLAQLALMPRCHVLSATTESIDCTLPALAAGMVRAYVSTVSGIAMGAPPFLSALRVDAVHPKSGWDSGALITVTGAGFSQSAQVAFDSNTNLVHFSSTPREQGLRACEGHCGSNADCADGFKCFQRSGFASVPGCYAGGSGDIHGRDYCYAAPLACPVHSWNATAIVCTWSGRGNASSVIIRDGAFSSTCNASAAGECNFTGVAAPMRVSGVAWSKLSAAGAVGVGIAGHGFVSGARVLVGAIEANTTAINATVLHAGLHWPRAGRHAVSVWVDGNFTSPSLPLLEQELVIHSVLPNSSGPLGGRLLTARADGVDTANASANEVRVCGVASPVLRAGGGWVQFRAPRVELNATAATAALAFTLVSGRAEWIDGDINTQGHLGTCYVLLDLGRDARAVLRQLRLFAADTWAGTSKVQGSVLEGSANGVRWETILTLPSGATRGFNEYSLPRAAPVRFVRYQRSAPLDKTCNVVELQLLGSRYSHAPRGLCDVKLVVNGITANASGAVEYTATDAPTVSAVVPSTGSIAGGALVTLYGTALGGTSGTLPRVRLGGMPCAVEASGGSSVTCRLAPRPPGTVHVGAGVSVLVDDRGYAALGANASFEYLDRWSASTTWGGLAPPPTGYVAVIPPGQTVLLDVSPPRLRLIIVEGGLRFEDASDIFLNASYIFVRGGRLEVGTQAAPFRHNAVITLHGAKASTPELPIYGAKLIAVRRGSLDLHGTARSPSWTQLAATAEAGASTLQLAVAPTGWRIGDRIVVASSNFSMLEAEELTVTGISGSSLAFAPALQHRHFGEVVTYGGKSIDMRSEVGLLSRNVVVRGDAGSAAEQWGGLVVLHSPGNDSSVGRLSNVEFEHCGQAFNLGRYPIHFHVGFP